MMVSRWSKYFVRRYLLKNEKRSGKRELVPFRKVNRIGIVYRVGSADDVRYMEYIEKQFEDSGKKVLSLGFVDRKELGADYQPNIHHDYFAKKDLSLLRLPRKTRVMRFVTEPFDYLIYCSEELSVPLLGITALSRAKCRVGPFFEDLDFAFDLQIKKSDGTNDYGEQVVKYIKRFDNG